MKIGDKVKGFRFKSDENVSYWNFMERFIGQVGTITEILPDSVGVDFGYKDVNENVLLVHYSIAEAKNHLVEPDYEQYIGRKIIGFKFEDYKGVPFTKGKASLVGSVGTITAVFDCHGCECFDVSFGVGIVYAYPCELAIEHIVNEETYATNQSIKTEPDMVNHPAHYGSGVYEVVEVLEAWGFEKEAHLTQAIQYIARYDKKGEPIKDLKKAIFWIQRKIMLLEKAGKK